MSAQMNDQMSLQIKSLITLLASKGLSSCVPCLVNPHVWKDIPHRLHWYSLIPLCRCISSFSVLLLLKLVPHKEQGKGFFLQVFLPCELLFAIGTVE